MRSVLSAVLISLVLAGTATATTSLTPRERSLTRQVSVLKTQVRKLKQANGRLSTRVLVLTDERNEQKEEVTRLRSLILNEVHGLAASWRIDGNPKTDVSYYESGSNYWSYSFTWCGFC
jgi:hypothetical protein